MEVKKVNFILELIKMFLNNKPILLIDDEEEIKVLMSNYLIKSQVTTNRIVTASDGREAILKIKNQDFGLIIIDILMPRMNGLQLIRELRRSKKYKDVPLLIISGSVDAENVKLAAAMGVTNIIVKPFSYNIFLEKISRTLSV